MAITPYLHLNTVGSSEEEIQMSFQSWRLLIAGDEASNMTKIDGGFYELTTKIEEVKVKTNLIKTDGLGDRFLSDDGTYKIVQGGGGGGSIFSKDEYLTYTATEDTDRFTLPDVSEDNQVILYKDNLLMMQGTDYSITKATGEVVLSFTLLEGESIRYQINLGIADVVRKSLTGNMEEATSIFLKDEVGNVLSPKVNAKDVIGYKPSVELADNLVTTEKGKALDATQGKILADIIGRLDTLDTADKSNIVHALNEIFNIADKGLRFKGVCQNDLLDTTQTSGIWITNISDSLTNLPSGWRKTTRKTIVNFKVDELSAFNMMLIIDQETLEVCYQMGVDFQWRSLTKETRFSFTCSTTETVSIITQDSYVENDNFVVNLRLKRVGDISFANMVVANIPLDFAPRYYAVGTACGKGTSGDYDKMVNCLIGTDGGIRILTTDTSIKEVILNVRGSF